MSLFNDDNLVENANDLIQSVDKNGRFVYVNRKWRETLGYSENELQNLKFTDILRPDHIPKCIKFFEKVCWGESFVGIETVFITKNGNEIPVEGDVRPVMNNNKFIAICGIFRDITKRKEAERMLVESEKKLRDDKNCKTISKINKGRSG